ncbi:MAG TPA: hypothetical protein VIG90_13850 [Pedomonas sp.]|uniref:hypothetical protein n=1 Tax=Pedomonas sp. TaxID=2976421 RepID=UPI002F42EEC6
MAHPEAEPEQGLAGLSRVLVGVGAVEGAAGVALAAVSAHAIPSEALGSAATLLMAHAGIVVALALIAARSGRRMGRFLRLPAALIALGVGLFATAIGLRVLGGVVPPTGMAPLGGSITIAGWLTLLIPALLPGRK